jgi:hypothetical protein
LSRGVSGCCATATIRHGGRAASPSLNTQAIIPLGDVSS